MRVRQQAGICAECVQAAEGEGQAAESTALCSAVEQAGLTLSFTFSLSWAGPALSA